MKIVILLIIVFCLTSPSKSQSMFSTIHLNEERDVHQGTPKSIIEYRVFYTSKGSENKKELTEYDQSGLPLSKKFFDENGNITSIVAYKYDTIKRVILESRINDINIRFPTNKIRTVYQYDADHSPVRIQYLSRQGEILTDVILKNNTAGLPVELRLYEPPENLIGIETASYLLEENKAIVSVANSEGRILTTDTMTISFKDAHKFNNPNTIYNEKGDLAYSQSRWLNGTIHFQEYDYIYDERGNWLDQKAFEVTYKSNGKKKRGLESHFTREIIYWAR